MCYKSPYKKENNIENQKWRIFGLVIIIAIFTMFIVGVYTELLAQPIAVEFSGRIAGNFQIENGTINKMEGSWKIKVPTYLAVSLLNG